ncbi:MAG: ThiF family adenylyltransferase [Acidobacteria bacterium]|nr:ThiF family adenylyltransferase [Acidobacteriota bacterium]MCA1637820.1 ThiF family adenylyltransferase [Acidobacteriota bacterium]
MNERYSRQILFAEIGKDGQEKLLKSRVLIVGCGALGASHAEMLARAGVGFLRIVDRDFVEFTNLQRQTLFSEQDAKERLPKAIAAKNRLKEINSEIEVEAIVADVNRSNIENLLEDCDLILDGTDNFQTRYLINDASVKNNKTWIYGAAVSSYGVTMTIIPDKTPCLRCVFEEIPGAGSSPTCDTAGVIQPIIATISAIQISEALKILVGKIKNLHQSLIQIDVWRNDWRKIKLGKPNAECKTCRQKFFEFLEVENVEFSAVLCGRDAVQISPPNSTVLDLPMLAEKLKNLGKVKQNEYLLRLSVDQYELTIFRDARAIVRGTDDITTARSVYAKYVGV